LRNPASIWSKQRILVLGCPGSGKSSFARLLADLTGLPLIHLDDHYWGQGWKRPDKDEWHATLYRLVSGERWIIDGNHQDSLELRMRRTDCVIFLDTPIWLCLFRVAARGLRRFFGESASLPRRIRHQSGLRARLHIDPKFVAKIVRFPIGIKPALLAQATRHGEAELVILRSAAETEALVRRFQGRHSQGDF
jgi:hypothetical protein